MLSPFGMAYAETDSTSTASDAKSQTQAVVDTAKDQSEVVDAVTSRVTQEVSTYKVVKNQSEQDQFSNSYKVAPHIDDESNKFPCPFGWSVRTNPSVDNSLSYVNSDANLAISVTNLENTRGVDAAAEAYAKVASMQMNCDLPNRSNLIENAWSFECPIYNVESIVYGEPGALVLLVISGRNADTQADLETFVKFLDSQAD